MLPALLALAAASGTARLCVFHGDASVCDAFNEGRTDRFDAVDNATVDSALLAGAASLELALFASVEKPIELGVPCTSLRIEALSSIGLTIAFTSRSDSFCVEELSCANVTVLINCSGDVDCLSLGSWRRVESSVVSLTGKKLKLLLANFSDYALAKGFDEIMVNQSDFAFPAVDQAQENMTLVLDLPMENVSIQAPLHSEFRVVMGHRMVAFEFDGRRVAFASTDSFTIVHRSSLSMSVECEEGPTRIPSVRFCVFDTEIEFAGSNWPRSPTSYVMSFNSTIVLSGSGFPITIASMSSSLLLKEESCSIYGYLKFSDELYVDSEGPSSFYCFAMINLWEDIDWDGSVSEQQFFEKESLEFLGTLVVSEEVSISMKFLKYMDHIKGGKSVSAPLMRFTQDVSASVHLPADGRIVVPFRSNTNETFKDIIKVYDDRIAELKSKGPLKPFDWNNFADSFKYYHLKFVMVFDKFGAVADRYYNRIYYPPVLEYEKPKNGKNQVIVAREDIPVRSLYRTGYMPILCAPAIDCDDFEVRVADHDYHYDLVSETRCTDKCIVFRLSEISTSSVEFLVYAANRDLLDSLKWISSISILKEENLKSIKNVVRNATSRNYVIVITEDTISEMDFSFLRSDANVFLVGLSVANANSYVDFVNTIRNGHDLKADLKRAIAKISPKIPAMFPLIRIKLPSVQSVWAACLRFQTTTIRAGAVYMNLCAFPGKITIAASKALLDLHSYENMMVAQHDTLLINLSILANAVENDKSDLLGITSVSFCADKWVFTAVGSVYHEVMRTFEIPYEVVESQLAIYSMISEMSLHAKSERVRGIHFISGRTTQVEFEEDIDNMSPVLSVETEKIIELPNVTNVKFAEGWESVTNTSDAFLFDLGRADSVIENVPEVLKDTTTFRANANLSIQGGVVEVMRPKGQVVIDARSEACRIDSMIFESEEHTSVVLKDETCVSVTEVECEEYSNAGMKCMAVGNRIEMKSRSVLDIENMRIGGDTDLVFCFDFERDLPYLTARNLAATGLPRRVVLKFDRKFDSIYAFNYSAILQKQYRFMTIGSTKCANFQPSIVFESSYRDFRADGVLKTFCKDDEQANTATFYVSMTRVANLDHDEEAVPTRVPLTPPYIYEPTPTNTPKESDHIGAIVGGVIGGIAFICIIIFSVYFCAARKYDEEDKGLLGSNESESDAPALKHREEEAASNLL